MNRCFALASCGVDIDVDIDSIQPRNEIDPQRHKLLCNVDRAAGSQQVDC